MMITNKFVIPFLLFCLFARSAALAAEATESASGGPSVQVSELPTVHILPDNPLYFLKTLKEKVQLLVTRNASGQADLLLDFSQKRLAEAQKVAEKGKVHISEKLLEAFGQDIEVAQQKIKQAKTRGEQTRDLLVKLQKLQGQAAQLSSFLVEIDQDLGTGEPGARSYTPTATPSAALRDKMSSGLGIFNWLRGLFGKKEILKPLAD